MIKLTIVRVLWHESGSGFRWKKTARNYATQALLCGNRRFVTPTSHGGTQLTFEVFGGVDVRRRG